MKKSLYTLFVVSCIVTVGCESKKSRRLVDIAEPTISVTDNDTLFHLKLNETPLSNDFILSEVESIEPIYLEANDSSLVGRINMVALTDSLIVVQDNVSPGKILAFHLDGSFSHQIGSFGEGPNDYASINQVFLDGNNVGILDWKSSKIVKYDLKGDFISSTAFQKQTCPQFIYPFKDGYIGTYSAYYDRNPFNIRIFDFDGFVTGTALPFKYDRPNTPGQIVSDKNFGKLFYSTLCDSIYCITSSNVTPIGTFGVYRPSEVADFIESTSSLDAGEYRKALSPASDLNIVNYVMITTMPDVWYIEYQTPQYCYSCVVDPATFDSKKYLRTDIAKKFCYFPFVIAGKSGSGSLLSYIDEAAFTLLSKENLDYLRSTLSTKGCNLSLSEAAFENSNPIILKFNLKKRSTNN